MSGTAFGLGRRVSRSSPGEKGIKKHFFEILPKIFDTMVLKLHKEIQENEALDTESYREARILYDESKPFFDEMKDIKIQASTSNEKEYHLQKSLVNFLDALKAYVKYLEIKFSDLDKPKYKTTLFTHVPLEFDSC